MSSERSSRLTDALKPTPPHPWSVAENALKERLYELRAKYCEQDYSLDKEDRGKLAEIVDSLIDLGSPPTGLHNSRLEDAGIGHLELIQLATSIGVHTSPIFSKERRKHRRVLKATREPLSSNRFESWNPGVIYLRRPPTRLERKLTQRTRLR